MMNLLKQLFELTKELVEAAESEDWERVSDLQQQRANLINELESLEKTTDVNEGDQARAIILQVQQLEKHASTLLNAQKKALVNQRSTQNKGKKMTLAYQSHNKRR